MPRVRFTIRNILVLTLLFGILSSWVAREYRQSSRQHSIADRLRARGADVSYNDSVFRRIDAVWFKTSQNVDWALPLIGELSELEVLVLQCTEFSNEQLHHLTKLKKLKKVDVNWTNISDDGLAQLSKIPSIHELTLNKALPPKPVANARFDQITDRGIAYLSSLQELELLTIWGAAVTDRSWESIAKCKKLQVLWLCETPIEGAGLAAICTLPVLRKLNLSGTGVTAESIECTFDIPSLQELSVARTQVSTKEALAYYARRDGGFAIGY